MGVVECRPLHRPMMAARVVKEVELGFVEEAEDPEQLTTPHFPSKVGGKPAWLDNARLPRSEDTECGACRKPMTFLLQVYAPVPVDDSTAPEGAEYHRTMFVFMCKNPGCHSIGLSKSFKVLRCQLDEVVDSLGTSCQDEDSLHADVSNLSLNADKTKGDESEFTPTLNDLGLDHNSDARGLDPVTPEPSESKTTDSHTFDDASQISSNSQAPCSIPNSQSHLCIVCGCSGPKRCGRCMLAHYCSKEHQTLDWKAGHKRFCEDLASCKLTLGDLNYDPSSCVALPEYEIVTELEPDLTSRGNGEQERSEEERMADYYKYIESGKCGAGKGEEMSAKALKDAATSEHKMDKQFRTFKKRVAIEPEQVIRYQRGGQPLLVSLKGAPESKDIPNCSCGAQRNFEFQIMPQLLYYLKLDSLTVSGPSIDWGTLLIYSCFSNCCSAEGHGFQQDIIWRQDFT